MIFSRIIEVLDGLPGDISLTGETAPVDFKHRAKTTACGLIPQRAEELSRVMNAYRMLNFQHTAVAQLVVNGKELPRCITRDDIAFVRLYEWYRSKPIDHAMMFAVGLGMEPRMQPERNILNALLICKDYDRERAARELHISPETLWLYEQLFFDIIDRRVDGLFATVTAYDKTTIEEQFDNYIHEDNIPKILLRAGFKNGMRDVLQLAGSPAGRKRLEVLSVVDARERLESEVLQNGLLLARNGWSGQYTNAGSVQRAQALMSAAKIGGQKDGDDNRLLDDSLSGSLFRQMSTDLRRQGEENQRVLIGAGGRN